MDHPGAVGTDVRTVREVEHEGQPAREIEGSRRFAVSAADLWGALTEADQLGQWFLPIQGDLKLGGRYQLQGHAGGAITGCDPQEALDLTWEFAENVSWVRLRLSADAGGTLLTLVHTMPKDEAGEAHWATYGPGAGGVGWDLSFFGLGMYLARGGEAFDRESQEAWLASADGLVFIRACAEAWGHAHVEAGEEAEVAAAMAARTASFYTGT